MTCFKTIHLFTFLIATLLLGCNNDLKEQNDGAAAIEEVEQAKTFLTQIRTYPNIEDSSAFIAALKDVSGNTFNGCEAEQTNSLITNYTKIKLHGSVDWFYLIELTNNEGCSAAFPWKYQFLFDAKGKLLKVFSALRFQLLNVFANENPFLLTVDVTSKGNGGHKLFKYNTDSLENVYEGYTNYQLKTYDTHQDRWVYQPNELKLNIQDNNLDGFNDLVFNGDIVLIQGLNKKGMWFDEEKIKGKVISYSIDHPFKTIPVEFVFIYDQGSGHFKAKEKYSDDLDEWIENLSMKW